MRASAAFILLLLALGSGPASVVSQKTKMEYRPRDLFLQCRKWCTNSAIRLRSPKYYERTVQCNVCSTHNKIKAIVTVTKSKLSASSMSLCGKRTPTIPSCLTTMLRFPFAVESLTTAKSDLSCNKL
jgi:hypothetical protein